MAISENHRRFVASLAPLVSPLEVDTAAAALMAMLPSLSDLPIAAFDRPGDLASGVAARFSKCPALGPLRREIIGWWEKNKPALAMLPGAEDPTLTREDQLVLQQWSRRRDGGDVHNFEVSLDVLRVHWPRVFRYLVRTDVPIASVAVRRGWQEEREPGWTDERANRNTVVRILAPLSDGRPFPMAGAIIAAVRAAVEHHAPHHMGAIDEEIAKASRDGGLVDLEQRSGEPATVEDVAPYLQLVTADFERRHGRKPGQVTPEQLAAIRQRRPAPEIEGDGSTFSWEREQ